MLDGIHDNIQTELLKTNKASSSETSSGKR
jgi:hypothetical protein